MLIDKTYFKGDLLIPNLNEPNPDENTTAVNLDELIDKVEEEVLSFSFGVKMWLSRLNTRRALPICHKIIRTCCMARLTQVRLTAGRKLWFGKV